MTVRTLPALLTRNRILSKIGVMNVTKYFMLSMALVGFYTAQAQLKIGDNPNTIGNSSLLELESTDKALVIPRVANTAMISNPVNGMIIYDNSQHCLVVYENGSWTGCLQKASNSLNGNVSALSCGSATFAPAQAIRSQAYTGTLTLNYSGGDGGFYKGQSVTSTGVTGLSASIVGGGFALGNGSLTFNVSGTPVTSGTASFSISLGGQTCNISINVEGDWVKAVLSASLSSYNAASAGDWVPVTAAEYNSILSSITGTSIGGIDDTYLARSPFSSSSWGGANHAFAVNASHPNIHTTSSGYMVAFSGIVASNISDGLSGMTVYIGLSQTGPLSQVGGTLPAVSTTAATPTRVYYVLKEPSTSFLAGYLGAKNTSTTSKTTLVSTNVTDPPSGSSHDIFWSTTGNLFGLTAGNRFYQPTIQCIMSNSRPW